VGGRGVAGAASSVLRRRERVDLEPGAGDDLERVLPDRREGGRNTRWRWPLVVFSSTVVGLTPSTVTVAEARPGPVGAITLTLLPVNENVMVAPAVLARSTPPPHAPFDETVAHPAPHVIVGLDPS